MLICYDQQSGEGCQTENPDGATQCQHCQRNLRFALHLHNPGTRIGDYRIVRKIGFGGFGAVYAAETRSGTLVALKESFNAAGITSFQGEFAVLQQLQHAHLPRYEAMFVAQGSGYLVMEFVPGRSLDEVQATAGGPLPETQVLGFALQLCEVLSYLHHQRPPLLHRDLKPANVRLTENGLIKLVDFGLFKQGTEMDSTKYSRMGWTPAYAPLEQHPLAPGHTDQRSDVYSLGATLYHLLTGTRPMAAAKRNEAPTDPLPPPQRLNPQLSSHVAAAVTKALRLKPAERYADIEAFRQALVGQAPRRQAPPPKPPQAPVLVIVLGVVASMMALIAVLALAFANRGTTLTAQSPTTAPVVTSAAGVVPPTLTPTTVSPTLTPTTIPPIAQPAWVPEMVAVPAGSFLMGSSSANSQAQSDEQPQHTLTLPAYEIGKTEVTNAQFRPFVTGDGYTNQAYWDAAGWQWRTGQNRTQPSYWNDASFNGDQQPVVGVTWYEAMAYTRWLSVKTGLNFSLPTEAEWEYAARGSKGLIYPWGNTWDATRANSNNTLGKTTPVGRYPSGASPFGAMDMAGNVWEWTQSVYTAYPYNASDGRENLSDPAGKYFTLRGGSWRSVSLALRAAYRGNLTPANDDHYVGLRLARHL